jgi:hypothetical protein
MGFLQIFLRSGLLLKKKMILSRVIWRMFRIQKDGGLKLDTLDVTVGLVGFDKKRANFRLSISRNLPFTEIPYHTFCLDFNTAIMLQTRSMIRANCITPKIILISKYITRMAVLH